MNFSDLLSNYPPFQIVQKNPAPVSVAGVVESAQAQLISETVQKSGKRSLVVCSHDLEAKQLSEELHYYEEHVYYFPSKEYVFGRIETRSRQTEHERLAALSAFADCGGILVASIEAVLDYTIPQEFYLNERCTLRVGSRMDLEELSQKLVRMGYVRESAVEGRGQFSVRGGILDVFLPMGEFPVRIEFFDDEVDSIRSFDPETQRSVENTEEVTLFACREAVFGEETKKRLLSELQKIAEFKKNTDAELY